MTIHDSLRPSVLLLLLLTLLGPVSVHADDPPQVLALTSTPMDLVEPPEPGDTARMGGVLIRELFRQAMLNCAREEFGLGTRDATLREPLEGAGATLEVVAIPYDGKYVSVGVRQASAPSGEFLWKTKVPLTANEPIDYALCIAKANEFSRSEFVKIIEQAGFSRLREPKQSSAELSSKTASLLEQMTFFDQFLAIRQIHDAIRKKGQSPNLLAGLVRGYANLFQLTQHVWSAAPKVFAARSLLYAERLVNDSKSKSIPLWNRAYARTVIGLHALALQDINAASNEKSEQLPSWAPLLKLSCEFDRRELISQAGKKNKNTQLALLLAFLTVEQSDSGALRRQRLTAMLDAQPYCFRAYDALCDLGEISTMHQITDTAPMLFQLQIAEALTGTTLPKSVRELLAVETERKDPGSLLQFLKKNPSDESKTADSEEETVVVIAPIDKICRQLVKVAGTKKQLLQEPSWAALGRLIEDTAFVHIQRRADFMRNQWGVDVADFLAASAPLVKDHPYANLIASYGMEASVDLQTYGDLLKAIKPSDFDYRMYPLIRAARPVPGNKGHGYDSDLLTRSYFACDDIARDLEYIIRVYGGELELTNAKLLAKTSPFDPAAYAVLIRSGWDEHSTSIKKWESQFANHPVVQMAIADHLIAEGKDTDAIRCLKQYIESADDYKAYEKLASIYKKNGDQKNWQKTLEDYLKQDDFGMNHSTIHEELAYDLIEQGKPKAALAHGKVAAESYSHSGLTCAVHCYEALGQWKNAEKYLKKITDRYEVSRSDWYFWCARTGKGNMDEARRDLQSYIEKKSESDRSATDWEMVGMFHLFENDLDKSRAAFQMAHRKSSNPYDALHLAMIAMQGNDNAARDAALQAAADRKPTDRRMQRPQLNKLGLILRNCAAKSGDDAIPDQNAVSALLPGSDDEEPNILYFTGRFLELSGHPELATEYLKRVAAWKGRTKWAQMLAVRILRERNIEVPKVIPHG